MLCRVWTDARRAADVELPGARQQVIMVGSNTFGLGLVRLRLVSLWPASSNGSAAMRLATFLLHGAMGC